MKMTNQIAELEFAKKNWKMADQITRLEFADP